MLLLLIQQLKLLPLEINGMQLPVARHRTLPLADGMQLQLAHLRQRNVGMQLLEGLHRLELKSGGMPPLEEHQWEELRGGIPHLLARLRGLRKDGMQHRAVHLQQEARNGGTRLRHELRRGGSHHLEERRAAGTQRPPKLHQGHRQEVSG